MPNIASKDYITPVVTVAAVGALGLGAWLMFKKRGVSPGATVEAVFSFDYNGGGGVYIFELSLGTIWPFNIFDHIPGQTWSGQMQLSVYDAEGHELSRPIHFNVKIPIKLPEGIAAKTWDVEAGIRLPGTEAQDFIEGTRILVDNALVVKK